MLMQHGDFCSSGAHYAILVMHSEIQHCRGRSLMKAWSIQGSDCFHSADNLLRPARDCLVDINTSTARQTPQQPDTCLSIC